MNLSLRFMNQFRESKAKIHESKSSFVNLSLRFILFIFVSLFLRFMNLSLKIHDIPLRFMNLIFLRFMNLMWRHLNVALTITKRSESTGCGSSGNFRVPDDQA